MFGRNSLLDVELFRAGDRWMFRLLLRLLIVAAVFVLSSSPSSARFLGRATPKPHTLKPFETLRPYEGLRPYEIAPSMLEPRLLELPRMESLTLTLPKGVVGDLSIDLANRSKISRQSHVAEAKRLKELLTVYPDNPNLLLRKALHQLERGRVELAVADLKNMKAEPLVNGEAFLNEVAARLRRPGLSSSTRSDVMELSRFASLREGIGRVGKNPEEMHRIAAIVEDGRLRYEYRMNSAEKPQQVKPEEFSGIDSNASIYVQDSPSFLNLDWSIGTKKTLHAPISGGQVYRFIPEGLADFRPAKVYSADGKAFKQVKSRREKDSDRKWREDGHQSPHHTSIEAKKDACADQKLNLEQCQRAQNRPVYLVADGQVRF